MQDVLKQGLKVWVILFLGTGVYTLYTIAPNATATTWMGLTIKNTHTKTELGNLFTVNLPVFGLSLLVVLGMTWLVHQLLQKRTQA